MKTGIVTFHRADNYGAVLQCYALYTVLDAMGCDAMVIDYRNPVIENRYRVVPKIRKNLVQWISLLAKTLPHYRQRKLRHTRFEQFRGMFKMSRPYSKAELVNGGADCDLIISGSDQVFNPNITNGCDDVYFLNIGGDFVRASYAASIGNVDDKQIRSEEFGKKISAFDYLSVREDDACNFLSSCYGLSVQKCLDPTLLLDEEHWREIVKDTVIDVPQKYILLYYVQYNSELIKIAQTLAKEKGLPVVCFKPDIKLDCQTVCCDSAGPLEFVKLIENADCVVTSSFHATAFSVIFKKDIHILTHSQTGSRVVSLAQIFGVSDRIYQSYADFESRFASDSGITYNTDDYIDQKERSLEYLRKITNSTE